MFVLNSNININTQSGTNYTSVRPHEVKITKSIFEYVDKAVIKIPITARIVQAGKIVTYTAETARQIGEGDKVLITLGYNNDYETEFEGFISRINFTTPLEVECEGFSYQLRKKQLSGTVSNILLIDVLRKITEGTDIILDEKNIPSFKIDKLILTGKDGLRILEEIKGTSKQLIRFFFTRNVLWGGLLYTNTKATVKYKMGWNVIKDGQLKLRQKKNEVYTVNWIGEKKDGSQVKATTGRDGIIKTHSSHIITDQSSLQQLSDAGHQKLTYDGYEGKITAFGQPYSEPGDKATIIDDRYPERGGDYIIQSTEVTYGMSGFRRVVGIGEKL